MSPIRVLHHEVLAFLGVLSALLIYRALTGKLSLAGLLSDKLAGTAAGPERVQLLIATLTVSFTYLGHVLHGNGTVMPDVSRTDLVVFGGSSGIYAAIKATKFWKISNND